MSNRTLISRSPRFQRRSAIHTILPVDSAESYSGREEKDSAELWRTMYQVGCFFCLLMITFGTGSLSWMLGKGSGQSMCARPPARTQATKLIVAHIENRNRNPVCLSPRFTSSSSSTISYLSPSGVFASGGPNRNLLTSSCTCTQERNCYFSLSGQLSIALFKICKATQMCTWKYQEGGNSKIPSSFT